MYYNVCVLGATSNVGRELINVLSDRQFPVKKLVALSSTDMKGKQMSFGKEIIIAQDIHDHDFTGYDIVFNAAGYQIAQQYYVKINESGALLIDCSSFFRTHEDVPLVIAEVNPQDVILYEKMGVISIPNAATTQLVTALKPLHDAYTIKRIVVSTYQAVSSTGKDAMDELYTQTKKMYENQLPTPGVYPKQIPFNCIPQVDSFEENGYTIEEAKIIEETKLLLGDDVAITATCVRVPVFNCHAESVNIEFASSIDLDEIYDILASADGVATFHSPEDGGYKTQVEVTKEDAVFVSRLRLDDSVKNGLNMWIVADNLRKGVAINAVRVAQIALKITD
jgi:aspartate-semialdehyde dehydrogenase